MEFRVASFNCENLFSRPRVFGEPAGDASALLAAVDELNACLSAAAFDHGRIAQVEASLAGHARVVDIRGNHSTAAGAASWVGWVELEREQASAEAILNTARVIADLEADVVCLVEVEDRIALRRFHDQILYPAFLQPRGVPPYPHVLLIDGNDPRGIDVAVLSRLPVSNLRTHVHEVSDYLGRLRHTFSRDCLEVDLALPGDRLLHVLVNHFKSRRQNADQPNDLDGTGLRLLQADAVARILSRWDPDRDLVLAGGDLNASPDTDEVRQLLAATRLHNALESLPPPDRWTYQYQGQREQIDYLLLSPALRSCLRAVRVERRGMYLQGVPRYPSVRHRTTQASDHAGIVATFELDP